MSSLYIHIPFCLRKCNYCDFYSVANYENFEEKYIDSLCENIRIKKLYDNSLGLIYGNSGKPQINTIYLGGGTPSLLSEKSFDRIIKSLKEGFCFDEDIEKTVEVNPATCDKEKLLFLRKFFNRISIGCQSFNDEELSVLGRLHDSKEAIQTVNNAYEVGFENISIDLMYRIPNQTISSFQNSLDVVKKLPVKHISIYELSFEENTPFCYY